MIVLHMVLVNILMFLVISLLVRVQLIPCRVMLVVFVKQTMWENLTVVCLKPSMPQS